MTFTVQAARFIKTVETVIAAGPIPAEGTLRLVACQDRVFALAGAKMGKTDAVIWEEGQCSVEAGEFLELLRAYRYENVTIEVDWQNLRIGGLAMPVKSCSLWAQAPTDEYEMAATD